jgi:hypothetical protein
MTIHIEVSQLASQIAALKAAFPELVDDAELLDATLEGETDLHGIVTKLLELEADASGMAEAIKSRRDALTARESRYKRQVDGCRSLIQSVMETTGQKKLTLPEATLSLATRAPEPIVTDETLLPEECFKVVRTIDKATIKAWCRAGNIPGGVTMSNGSVSLHILTK